MYDYDDKDKIILSMIKIKESTKDIGSGILKLEQNVFRFFFLNVY